MILEYDTIILGSSLNAFLLSAQKFCPVIFSDFRIPFRFDYFDPNIDLSFLNIPQDLWPDSLTTFSDEIRVGIPKHVVWERLYFNLSMNGLVPLSNLCKNIRFDDNKIVCSNEYSKIAEIHFNNCIYFGDDGLIKNENKNILDNAKFLCYDWIAFNKGGKHEIDFFETSDRFVNKVWFYPSDRIDGNTAVKDACVVSSLTKKEIEHFDFSETMSRFKLVHEMESRGMKGLFNGYGANGKPKHYKFKTTHMRREKRDPNKDLQYCPKTAILADFKEEDLLQDISQIYLDDDRFLRGLFEQPRTHGRHNTSS